MNVMQEMEHLFPGESVRQTAKGCRMNIEELDGSHHCGLADLSLKGFDITTRRSGTGLVVIIEKQ